MLRRARYDVRMLDVAWGPAEAVTAFARSDDFQELAKSIELQIPNHANEADIRRIRMWIARCASRPTPLASTSGIAWSTATGASTTLETDAAFDTTTARPTAAPDRQLRWNALAVDVAGSVAVERADGNSSQEYISLTRTPAVEQFRAITRFPATPEAMQAALVAAGIESGTARRGIRELTEKHFLSEVQSAIIANPAGEASSEPSLRQLSLDIGRDLLVRAQRLANLPFRQSHVQRAYRTYVERFVERFGPDELVPLSKVVSPGGIGRVGTLLAHEPPTDRAQMAVMERLFASSSLLQASLDDSWLEALANARSDDGFAPQVVPTDLLLEPYESETGAPFWFLSPTAFRDGLTITPRWLHRASPEVATAVAASARWWQAATTTTADVDYVPSAEKHAALTRRPPLGESRIAISTTPSTGDLDVARLLIGQVSSKLILVDAESQRQIVPLMASAYNPSLCPAAVELLATMRLQYGQSPDVPFPTPSRRPVTPRLTLGPDVIAAAQWSVPGKRSATELAVWLTEHHAPALLTIRSGDKHVSVNRGTRAGLDYLASRTRRDRTLHLSESLASTLLPLARDANGRRYASEIALAAIPAQPFAPMTTHRPLRESFTLNETAGQRWVTLKIYADEAYHDTLLTQRLHRWATDAAHLDTFYIRYRDPLPHIRLRARTKTPDHLAPHTELHQLARDLQAQTNYVSNCAVTTYSPELRRFDTLGASPDALFDVFVTDSALCVAITATGWKKGSPTWLLGTAARIAEFAQHAPEAFEMFKRETSDQDRRAARAALAPYAARWDGQEDLLSLVLPTLGDASNHARSATAKFRRDRDVSPDTWLSLAHLTMNRLGATEQQESTAFGLASMVLAASRSRKHHLGRV